MRGNQARVKNADVRHPSSTVLMYRRKSASPVHNVLITKLNNVVRFTILYFLSKLLEWSDVMVKNLGPLSFLPNRSYRNQRMSARNVFTMYLHRSAVFISSLSSSSGYPKHFQEHLKNNTGRPLC